MSYQHTHARGSTVAMSVSSSLRTRLRNIIPDWIRPQIDELNEAVNFDKQTIFIAIPKTGSTSIRFQLAPSLRRLRRKCLIPNPHLDIVQIRDSLYVHFLRQSLGRNDRFPNPAVLQDTDVRALAEDCFCSFFKFSVVRNPWARTVSLYYRSEGIKYDPGITFERFCDLLTDASDTCIHPTAHPDQAAWLVDECGRILVDNVTRLEELSENVSRIEQESGGRVKLANEFRNVNANSRSKQYRNLYNDRTRLAIAKRFERDIDYFKYAF